MHTMLKTLISATVITGMTMATYVAHLGEAVARGQPAFLGAARHGSEANCFYEAAGGPHQKNCSGAPEWVLPLVNDAAETHHVDIVARGANGGHNNVNCRAYSATANGGLTVGAEAKTILNTGGTEHLKVSVFVQPWGAAWVTCSMAQGTRLYHMQYGK